MYAILGDGEHDLQRHCRRLFVFSQAPWNARSSRVPLPRDSEAMWERLIASGDISPELAADEEYREFQEPIIRADYDVLDQLPAEVAPLSCPLVAVAGLHDGAAQRMRLPGWAQYAAELDTVWCPCGHMPMQELPGEAAKILVDRS